MRFVRFISLIGIGTLSLVSNVNAGHVQDWLDAHGGCEVSYRSLRPNLRELKISGSFLDRPGIEWTDAMLEEFSSVYAECYSSINRPKDIPRSMWRIGAQAQESSVQLSRELRDQFVEPARQAERQRQAGADSRKRLQEQEKQERADRIERTQRDQETASAEQARQDAERVASLRSETTAADASRIRLLKQAQEHAQREREIATEISRQAEAEEKHLAELKRINEEARQHRQSAETRLAQARAATETEQRRAEAEAKASPNPEPAKPERTKSTPAPSVPAPVDPPRSATSQGDAPLSGCEHPKVRQLMIDEFNRAAERKDLPHLIDLDTIATESFSGSEAEAIDIACLYTATLENGKHQRFRLSLKSNSLGTPFIRIQPQGRHY